MSKSGIWVYEYDRRYPCKYDITEVRYVLGEIFDASIPKALICIGINPSTAIPEHLDYTLSRVQAYAKDGMGKGEYGAWYMLNIYPQRSTDPEGIHKSYDLGIHERNYEEISALLGILHEADIWCAWGETITQEPYLSDLLCGNSDKNIKGIMSLFGENHTLKAFDLTEKGHPKHPRMMPKLSRLKPLKGLLSEKEMNWDDYIKLLRHKSKAK